MDDSGKDFLGRGWAFPVALDPRRGRIAFVEHEEDVEQSIRIILATSKGERVMRPEFGCGIHDLVFGAVTTSFITQVKNNVTDALREFEARIDVMRVEVSSARIQEGVLEIELEYRNRSTNQTGNLVYPFYFKEAS